MNKLQKVGIALLALIVCLPVFGAMNFVRDAGTVNYVATTGAITNDAVVDLGDRYGIAMGDIASNATGTVRTDGIWTGTLTSNQTISVGDRLYYTAASATLTETATAGTYIGAAVAAVTTATAGNSNSLTGIVTYELNAAINNGVIGVDVQAYDADLASVAAMSGIVTTNLSVLLAGGTTNTSAFVIDP